MTFERDFLVFFSLSIPLRQLQISAITALYPRVVSPFPSLSVSKADIFCFFVCFLGFFNGGCFSSVWTGKLFTWSLICLFSLSLSLSRLEYLLQWGFRLKPRTQSCFISARVWENFEWGHARKMFNFLLRKDVRKILKRKDSDAGEKGTLVSTLLLLVILRSNYSRWFVLLLLLLFSTYFYLPFSVICASGFLIS